MNFKKKNLVWMISSTRKVCLIAMLFIFSIINFASLKAEEVPSEQIMKDSTELKYYGDFQLKSESHAFKSSLWATIGPLSTLYFAVPGLVFGPSLGYFYADMPGRAWKGIGIRTLGVVGMFSAFAWSLSDLDCFTCENSDSDMAEALFIASASVVVFSAVYDIATVKKALRNKKASMLQTNFSVEPQYFANTKSLGIGINLRF